MRIAIIAPGSRGDVQPYIALGKGLVEAGDTVRFATHQDFDQLVQTHGLEFWPVEGSIQEIAQTDQMSTLIEKGNFLMLMSQMAKEAQRGAIRLAEGGLAACQDMDLILGGMGGVYIGLSLAEKLGLPFIQAYLVPFTPTRAFPTVLLPGQLPRQFANLYHLSHHITRQIMWQGFRSADNIARKEVLGLSRAPFWGPYNSDHMKGCPILYGFSEMVVPKPSDWDNNLHVTGYWSLETTTEWSPPPPLLEFFQSGSLPVYIGFGSMSHRNPEETADLVLEALSRAQQRAILLSGWGGLRKDNVPSSVFMLDSIPHSWLFPRAAAVVHHGGAGTTAAGLRAGVPSIVVPFFGDQPFWGHRIAQLGVGPTPIPRRKLTPENLANAILTAVADQPMRDRATALGSKIRAEDGVARAVEVIHSYWDQVAA
jgi:UDP:flavonoid glycosyltransferase YjiC (YdhE family)